MSQTERRADKAEKSAPSNLIPPELAATGKKRFDELVAMQTEQLEKLQEVNRSWIDRMQSQAKLGSEFVAKLTAARSIPEVATAYKEWASRQMEMAAEDAKRIFADGTDKHIPRYLIGTPQLGDSLEEGLATLGISLESFEIGRL
jgi:hypothetical protein